MKWFLAQVFDLGRLLTSCLVVGCGLLAIAVLLDL